MMMAWSDLPEDPLRCISSHLTVVDFLRLSSVCRSWNRALASDDLLRILRPPSPWLLLPSVAGEDSDTLTFRDFNTIQEQEGSSSSSSSHRCFSSLGSHISGRRCIGSKDGWLVTLDNTDLQPRLFNPLTKKAEISLPSLFTIPEDGEHRIKPDYASDGSFEFYVNEIHPVLSTPRERFRDVYFHKIVLSSNDFSGTAIVIYGYQKFLALARPGDQTWVLGPQLSPNVDIPSSDDFEDIYYHEDEEERRFYAITHFSAVIAFDINGQNDTLICPAIFHTRALYQATKNYIVFLSGTLIKIKRVIECIDKEPDDSYTWKTIKISVFKFVPAIADSSCSSCQWISVKDLEGCSLFVGSNQTFSLHHTVASGIRPNCIYFSDDWEDISPEDVDRDAGFFDLHNDCFQYFLDSHSQPNWPPSIW